MRRSQSYLSAGKPGDWIIFPADVPSRSRSHFPESRTGRLADKVNRLWLDLAWWGEFSSTARGVTSRKKTHQVKDERELLQQNIAAEVDLSSVCRKRGRRVDADVFFKMSSEFVKGSIRATSSMNTLKSELGGGRAADSSLLLCFCLFTWLLSDSFSERLFQSDRGRLVFKFGPRLNQVCRSQGDGWDEPPRPSSYFKILICDRWETLCKMFAERPSHSLFIYLSVMNTQTNWNSHQCRSV